MATNLEGKKGHYESFATAPRTFAASGSTCTTASYTRAVFASNAKERSAFARPSRSPSLPFVPTRTAQRATTSATLANASGAAFRAELLALEHDELRAPYRAGLQS